MDIVDSPTRLKQLKDKLVIDNANSNFDNQLKGLTSTELATSVLQKHFRCFSLLTRSNYQNRNLIYPRIGYRFFTESLIFNLRLQDKIDLKELVEVADQKTINEVFEILDLITIRGFNNEIDLIKKYQIFLKKFKA